jgi:hypothetical protein
MDLAELERKLESARTRSQYQKASLELEQARKRNEDSEVRKLKKWKRDVILAEKEVRDTEKALEEAVAACKASSSVLINLRKELKRYLQETSEEFCNDVAVNTDREDVKTFINVACNTTTWSPSKEQEDATLTRKDPPLLEILSLSSDDEVFNDLQEVESELDDFEMMDYEEIEENVGTIAKSFHSDTEEESEAKEDREDTQEAQDPQEWKEWKDPQNLQEETDGGKGVLGSAEHALFAKRTKHGGSPPLWISIENRPTGYRAQRKSFSPRKKSTSPVISWSSLTAELPEMPPHSLSKHLSAFISIFPNSVGKRWKGSRKGTECRKPVLKRDFLVLFKSFIVRPWDERYVPV